MISYIYSVVSPLKPVILPRASVSAARTAYYPRDFYCFIMMIAIPCWQALTTA